MKEALRAEVLDAANAHRIRRTLNQTPYRVRHLQRAVCVCRRNKLLKPGVLSALGFNE